MAEQEKVQIRPDVSTYVPGVSGSGKRTKRKDDEVAAGLDGMNIDEVKAVASAMGVDNVDKYDHLNVGQQRMNLGNRIRGAVSRLDKAKEELQAAAENEDATASVRREAKNAKTGSEAFQVAIKTHRRVVDARIAEAKKKAEAKAKEKAAKAAA